MKYDALIVGGGMAGLTAAAFLAKAGKSVALIEQQSKLGGLVQTFHRNQVYFDGGLRSIENSGIVFPMLKQLGIKLDFVKSKISIGIADEVLILEDHSSVDAYSKFLKTYFPDNQPDVDRIIDRIRVIMQYMDVLYGIDNPAFLDFRKDQKYFLKVVLPWMGKFLMTIRKINRLDEPVEDYLKRLSSNQALIDLIAQHFFQATPTSFALSYFSLYLDYYYPRGGTASLVEKMERFFRDQGGIVKTSLSVETLHPEEKYVIDSSGNKIEYQSLIWAGDQKQLYTRIPLAELKNQKLIRKISQKRDQLKDLKGSDSVFAVYCTVAENKEYFEKICTGHFFYTPDKRGLSSVSKGELNEFLDSQPNQADNQELKSKLKKYLREYCLLNTFEIAIPVLRDESMAPAGKVGVAISLLFDYQLARKIEDFGWTREIKLFLEEVIIECMDASIFPGFKNKVTEKFSSSPITIEKMTGNTDGSIVGWSFANPVMPSVNRMMKVAKSVETIIPSVYQAGQWVYSPAGLPISILTGKLAADKVLKKGRD